MYDFNLSQMAFDTLDHTVFLEKMKCTSFSGNTIKWFCSYLTNRAIFVSLGTVFGSGDHILQSFPRVDIETYVRRKIKDCCCLCDFIWQFDITTNCEMFDP